MNSAKFKTKLIFILLVFGYGLQAQIDSYIGSYTGANKDGYLQPVASVLTSAFNTGLVTHTRIDSNFHVYFHLIGTSSFIVSNKLKYFNATTEGEFEPSQTASVSTILGPRVSQEVSGINGTAYLFPAGMGVKILSLAVPQLSFSFSGTELIGRFFAYDTKSEIGKINLLGIGLRHDIGRYFIKNSDWILTIGGLYQKISAGTYLDLSTYHGGLTLGQQKKHFYYFLQGGYQAGKITGDYKHYNGSSFDQISFDLKNKNPLFIGIGTGLQFGALQIQAQISGYEPIIGSIALGLKF